MCQSHLDLDPRPTLVSCREAFPGQARDPAIGTTVAFVTSPP